LEFGKCCSDFLEKETTINSQHYIETITVLKRRIERMGIRNATLVHHDARPHTSVATRDAIQCLTFQCCCIHRITHIWLQVISTCSHKEHLKGQRFSCDEELNSAVRKWFQKQKTNFFMDRFKKTSAVLAEVYGSAGDFVEK
jgi:hypothetical protein